MSAHKKVVWSEGLFLQPQHFQQQDRYFERFVEGRCQGLIPYSWGFTEIELERDLLSIGKFALRRAAGIFPDGTPFRMPDDDPLPAPIDVGPQVRDQIVYLAVPVRRGDAPEVDRTGGADGLVRHDVREWEARDATSASGNAATLEVGALRTRLLLAGDVTQAYACVPLAHLIECRGDKQVLLDDKFIPTVLHARAASRLATFMTEIVGVLHQQGDALSSRVSATDRGGAAQVADFLRLQAMNRYEPLFAHFADSGGLHPEELFRVCVSAAGELATFTPSKRAPALTAYRHDRLRESFEPVMAALLAASSAVSERERDSNPDRGEEVRHQRRRRRGSSAVRHGRLHPGGAGRSTGRRTAEALSGAAQDWPGREDSRSCESPAARGAGSRGTSRAAADPVSCGLRVLRARSVK